MNVEMKHTHTQTRQQTHTFTFCPKADFQSAVDLTTETVSPSDYFIYRSETNTQTDCWLSLALSAILFLRSLLEVCYVLPYNYYLDNYYM